MAIPEGCRRLRTAGRVLIFCGVIVLGLSIILVALGYAFNLPHITLFIPLALALVLFLEAAGIVLWLTSWILEGFASPSTTESNHRRQP
jgi:hypothetical protein